MDFTLFGEFWCFSLGKQARFTLNFCSGMPLRKVHELTFFGLVCRATPDYGTFAKPEGPFTKGSCGSFKGQHDWATRPGALRGK